MNTSAKSSNTFVPDEQELSDVPTNNADIRPWISIGEAAQLALSKIEHDMQRVDAPKAEALIVRDNLKAARDHLAEAINVIELWAGRGRV